MIHANTICVSEEGPANALALNKDCTQVVIAGRNVFKVFSIGENDFTEACNLRVGKNLNLNFSSIDVAWSTIEENTLATAATNGAVVVWNLGRSGRSKQEHVFSDHKRTVNKVSFHLTEPSLLISGSQDGMMKCFDLRMKEVARTFISNTESIRDVQFNPHSSQTFAAVSENGSVQLWDVRRHERCLQQFTAHSGPVFACDWHPDVQWLATASRDKTIKVWDMHAKPNLEHTIYTIASVGHVKWRPQKKHQVASCALVLDCAVHVWDVRRPHLPLATFAEHRDVTTAIAWQSSDTFLSTSRDSSLYRLGWSSAAHPVLWANPHGVCVSARHDLAHAAPASPLPPLAHAHTDPRPTTLGRKQPTAGSLTPAAQAALERLFPGGAGSILSRYRAPTSPFVACAVGYKIRGAPPHELAEHNAKVARDNERHMVAHVWEVVRAVCAAPPAPPPARLPPPPNPAPAMPPHHNNNAVEEEPMEEVEEWTENQFHNSGVLGLPTHSIYIPPTKFAKQINNDDTTAWISAASAHYVDVEAADWSLPEEAFPLRTAPPDSVPNRLSDEKDGVNHNGPSANASSSSPGGTSSSGSGSRSGSTGSHNNVLTHSIIYHSYSQQSSVNTVEESDTNDNSLSVRVPLSLRPQLDMAPLLDATLRHHAALGDVQTPAVVLLILHAHRNELFPYIEEGLQEQWLLGYIELLQRHKLYNQAAEVVRCSWISSVWQISQQSTSVALSCGRCGKRTKPRAACECSNKPDLCAVCHQVVRGLFAWCQGCSHGGHLHHLQQWMKQHQLCPAGCGHHCQLG